jgi:uncharacterized phage protein (TIGR01671 family)
MKREIKFRAWDSDAEYMVYSDKEDADYWWEFKPIRCGCIIGETAGTSFEAPEPIVEYYEDIMQFTGLKDRNGKEIYEGDILRFPAEEKWGEENYSCFEVFFHDGDANSDYNIGFTMNRMHNHGAICGGWIPPFKSEKTAKMEVIGNIYQNPELI